MAEDGNVTISMRWSRGTPQGREMPLKEGEEPRLTRAWEKWLAMPQTQEYLAYHKACMSRLVMDLTAFPSVRQELDPAKVGVTMLAQQSCLEVLNDIRWYPYYASEDELQEAEEARRREEEPPDEL